MFASFFNPEGKFFRIGSKAADLLLASVLWLVCCLPLVTVGPACTALYDVVVRNIHNGQGSGICRDFLRVFRQNFRQSVGLMLIFTTLAAAALVAAQLYAEQGASDTVTVWFLRAILVVVMMAAPYGFALISRFENTFGRILLLTLYLTFRHLPTSLVLAILLSLGGLLVYLHLPLAVLMPGLICLLMSLLLERVICFHAPEAVVENREAERSDT